MVNRPNILLIVMDSVRARNCSVYGHNNNTTPRLEELSNESTLYTQARSPSINSIQSHTSIFTGYNVNEHNISEHNSYINPEENIWQKLKIEHEYNTGIFSPNAVITEASNLCDVFEKYSGPKRNTQTKIFDSALDPTEMDIETKAEYIHKSLRSSKPLRSIINGINTKFLADASSYDPETEVADIYINEFINWVEDNSDHWAACINLMDAHEPYIPSEQSNYWGSELLESVRQQTAECGTMGYIGGERPWGEIRAIEPLYDGCIRQIDSAIETLIDKLKSMGEYENTLLVITSDHGQAFAEQSRVNSNVRLNGHAYGIHEVLTHIPLIVKRPNQSYEEKIDSISSLAKFPKVVKDTISGNGTTTFVPDDGVVVASTDRLKPPGDSIPLDKETRKQYFGPWRAVYREENGKLFKYIERNGDKAVVQVRDAQTSFTVERPNTDIVENEFNKMNSLNIGREKDIDMDKNVEQRLADLGYK
ncbi:sulfatase-like hydrolase/transferase [Halorubrum cibi]|uniref:Arylsulfatase A n=1 Tax=Halorubrum cibi TaxID=413815 RepID=A0A521F349_9EURY|nr:sulfatase-like hydrolase/transferase [Halorubrum cibi]SMO90583.1 Arylsulfatase A [Halorubrum cibi]